MITFLSFVRKYHERTDKKISETTGIPGGKTAFKEYIKKNLVYPKEALEKRVEGVVHLSARIDDNGQVSEVVVEKGIGSSCDEEAQRLIKSVHFGAVKNKGVRLKTRQRFRIEFRLPATKKRINYYLKKTSVPNQLVQKNESQSYSYTVTVNATD